ncbi:MAG: RHS repeat-associated core domain-containing protein [Luteolibacter sp.]|uniref:RHS repeat domain-containing protein n=1 Tax=Luteolibacter sp. TaxID=1962973 RepID=UPI003265BFF7
MSSSSSSPDVPTPDCNDANGETPSEPASGGGSNGGGGGQQGAGKVNPSAGRPDVGAPAMPSSVGGLPLIGMAYDFSGGGSAAAFGGKWNCGALAGLAGTTGGGPATNMLSYDTDPKRVITFTPALSGDSYQAGYFILDQLKYVPGEETEEPYYQLLKPSGQRIFFSPGGRVRADLDPGGITSQYEYGESGNLTGIVRAVGGYMHQYAIQWSEGKITEIVYSSGESEMQPILRISYGYVGNDLKTVKISQWVTGAEPGWGPPISSTLYSYEEVTGRLRHIVGPDQYLQMVHNGINPELAAPDLLNNYATSEYQYWNDGRVKKLFTNGRKYTYGFNYFTNRTGDYSINAWSSQTVVTAPDGSIRTYYFNRGGQMLLKKVSQDDIFDSPVWYPIYQRYEEGSARIILSADASAIGVVSEANPRLVTLKNCGGKVTRYSYTDQGYRKSVELSEGERLTPEPFKVRSYTYEPVIVENVGIIQQLKTESIYPVEGGPGITTTYDRDYFANSLQPSKIATLLPDVPPGENGWLEEVATEAHFNIQGLLVRRVDGGGSATSYEYDSATGGMTVMIQDEEGLNLRTDYELDARGRCIATFGPAHFIDFGEETAKEIRTASWTRYNADDSEVWNFQGYRTLDEVEDKVVSPVSITRRNMASPDPEDPAYLGWWQSQTIDVAYSGDLPAMDESFPQTDWVRWKVDLHDQASETVEQWTYFDIPDDGYGSQGENYGRKLLEYDLAGREYRTTCPGGTTDQTDFNAMGWPVTEWLGIREEIAGLVMTRRNEYDSTGNVITVTLWVDGDFDHVRAMENSYDWRHRLEQMQQVVEKDDGGTPWTLITGFTYDNRDLRLSVTNYHTELSSSYITSQRTTDYDVLGRAYRAKVYGVRPLGDSTIPHVYNPQESNTYYDANNRVVRSAPSGSKLFTATKYDALGRTKATYRAYDPVGYEAGNDPGEVVSSIVMEQEETDWDDADNLVGTTRKDRYDDDSDEDLGELGAPDVEPKARISHVASYADGIGRAVATANFGTSDWSGWERPPQIPDRGDKVLVTTNTYDAAGNLAAVKDPGDKVVETTYDNADRKIKIIENVTGGPGETRTTRFEYTDDSWLEKLISENPATSEDGVQVTHWVRGVTPTKGSALYSNRLVYQKIYPDGGPEDCVTYTYNRQLQVTGMTDQNGSVHAYDYDKLGRLLTDRVTSFGSGIDTAVSRLETGYNERGLVLRSTSLGHDGEAVVVRNEVKCEYNGFNQLATEYQEHAGAVDGETLKVAYSYVNGSANTTRPTGITYPDDGTGDPFILGLAYKSSMAESLGRIDEIKDGTIVLSSWQYIGLGMVAAQKYNAASGVKLTYGSSDNAYDGYDAFGAIAATVWQKGGTTVVASSYGRNRVSGVLWRRDDLAHAMSIDTQDNYYEYDGLRQVVLHDRGDLAANTSPPPAYAGIDPITRQQQECFVFDETGNWGSYSSQEAALVQNRTHVASNQIESITNPTGVIQPTYDAVGNIVGLPRPDDWSLGYDCTWDAWNRLVSLTDGSSPVATYAYDAFARRIITDTSEVREYYFNNQWRAIEERVAGAPVTDYVYSPTDRWNLIRRRWSFETRLDATDWCLRDYLDPVAIVDNEGDVVERYGYEAFGPARIMDSEFAAIGSSTVGWIWLFHGEFIDRDTGLYNYGYRYYSPQLGRWLSKDPIGEDGGLNLYAFVGNNSTNQNDYLGLDTQNVDVKVIGHSMWGSERIQDVSGLKGVVTVAVNIEDCETGGRVYLGGVVDTSLDSGYWEQILGFLHIPLWKLGDLGFTYDKTARYKLESTKYVDCGGGKRKMQIKFSATLSVHEKISASLLVLHEGTELLESDESPVVDGPCCCPPKK